MGHFFPGCELLEKKRNQEVVQLKKVRLDFKDKKQKNLRIENLEAIAEFISFCAFVQKENSRELTPSDTDMIQGTVYRGTSIFMTLVSLYSEGSIYSIKDCRHNGENYVRFDSPFVSLYKEVPRKIFANSVMSEKGRSRSIEKDIFARFLIDNELQAQSMPEFLLQGIVLPLHGEKITDLTCYAKEDGERIGFDLRVDPSILKLFTTLLPITIDEFTDKFPILSRLCGMDITPRLTV